MLETASPPVGGHWSLLLNSIPFDSINLAGDGYKTHQIKSQVRKALSYKPETIVVMAGINDIFGEDYHEDAVLREFSEIAALISGGSSNCLITLAIKPHNKEKANAVLSLNRQLKARLKDSSCALIDLNPFLAPSGTLDKLFTSDGVHLNYKGYAIWASELKRVL